jgi:hypothetical protein
MTPPRSDGALIITFPRVWTAAQRLAFMADVARALPRERWAHMGELMCTDSIEATATERRAVFARLTARRARGVDELVSPCSSGRDERQTIGRQRRLER